MAERDFDLERKQDDRIGSLERAMSDLVHELRPLFADLEYAKRRREEERRSVTRTWLVLKVLAGFSAALPVVIESYIQLARAH